MTADRLERRILAMARVADPASNSAESERGVAAREIQALVPRLVAALSVAPAPIPPAPAVAPSWSAAYVRTPGQVRADLRNLATAWEARFGSAFTREQRTSARHLLMLYSLNHTLGALSRVAPKRDEPGWQTFGRFMAICRP